MQWPQQLSRRHQHPKFFLKKGRQQNQWWWWWDQRIICVISKSTNELEHIRLDTFPYNVLKPNLSNVVTFHRKHLLLQAHYNKGSYWGSLKSLLRVHKKVVWKAHFILTKTQPVSGKLPFVIIRKLRWVYVNIIVSIYLLNNLPLYFIHGFLVGEKGKDVSSFNDQCFTH